MHRRQFFGASLAAAALGLAAKFTRPDPIRVRHERRGDLRITHFDVQLKRGSFPKKISLRHSDRSYRIQPYVFTAKEKSREAATEDIIRQVRKLMPAEYYGVAVITFRTSGAEAYAVAATPWLEYAKDDLLLEPGAC